MFKQWGKGHDTQFVTFPIAFTKQAFCCIVTPIGGGQGSDRVYSLSVKSFPLPISFLNSAYIGLVTICRGNSLSQGVLSSYISNLTTTNFYLYFDKTVDNTTNKIYWFVIGK